MKQKSQKQKKADKAFVKKISSLNIGGKFVSGSSVELDDTITEIHVKNCPCCKGNHVLKLPPELTRPRHDDSQEQAITA